jgi:hypothetical protein
MVIGLQSVTGFAPGQYQTLLGQSWRRKEIGAKAFACGWYHG